MFRIFSFVSLTDAHVRKWQHLRGQPSVPHAPNAASSGDPANSVVAVAAVLGSETAEMLVTQQLSTGGTRACRSAGQAAVKSLLLLKS